MTDAPIKIEQGTSLELAQWTGHQSLTNANPGSPLNDPSFQNAQRAELYILRQIQVATDRLPRNAKRTILQKKLKKVQRHHRSMKKTIAIVGMTGHGKSSVLGETVENRGVAKTSGIGRAVTHTAQEFQQRPPDASHEYALVCRFMKLAQRKRQMEELLDDWRRIDLEGITPNDREYITIRDNARAALEVMKSALSGVSGFDLQLVEYGPNGVTREAAIEKLHYWVDQMPLPTNGMSKDGKFIEEFDDTKGLQQAVLSFQKSGLWCFVKQMEIFFDSDVLKDGLVIADLPGSFDSNHIRAKTADKFLHRAGEVWIVVRIDRAVDSPMISEIADRYYRVSQDVGDLYRPVVNIICTFAAELPDDIDWVNDLSVNEETLQEAEEQYEDAEDNGSAQEIALAKYRLRKLKMEARNAWVTAELKNTWSSTFAPQELKVFCVDNKLHRSNNQMEKELSGIPALRQYASNLMAQVLYKNAMESLLVKTPALIRSYQTYIDVLKDPPADLEKELAVGLKEIEQAHMYWAAWQESVSGAYGDITTTIQTKRLSIIGSAHDCLTQWGSLPWITIGAFFRRGGVYKVPGSSVPVSWCGQLLECILRFTRSWWRKLDKRILSAWQSLIANIIGRFEAHESRYENGIGPDTVIRLLRNRKDNLKSLLEAEKTEFTQKLLAIKRKAVTSDTKSYIYSFMDPIFKEGAADSGTLSCPRRPVQLASDTDTI